MLEINSHPRFDRHYKKLPKNIKAAARERERVFRETPFHPSLRTHKLHGKDTDMWAFWINQKYRIKFVFVSPAHVLFLDIGTHDLYA